MSTYKVAPVVPNAGFSPANKCCNKLYRKKPSYFVAK